MRPEEAVAQERGDSCGDPEGEKAEGSRTGDLVTAIAVGPYQRRTRTTGRQRSRALMIVVGRSIVIPRNSVIPSASASGSSRVRRIGRRSTSHSGRRRKRPRYCTPIGDFGSSDFRRTCRRIRPLSDHSYDAWRIHATAKELTGNRVAKRKSFVIRLTDQESTTRIACEEYQVE